MERNQIKDLLVAAAYSKDANVNFTDLNSAAKNGLIEYFGLDDLSVREIKRYSADVFALIEEVIEQVLPMMLADRVGMFAEIKTFARDEQVKFTIKNQGKRRVVRGIAKGARGGIYRAKKLQDADLIVPTFVYSVGYQITLEELLTGRRTVGELATLITEGFLENIYLEIIQAMRGIYNYAPANNKATASTMDLEGMKKVIRTVRAYGSPVILGFQTEIEKLINAVPGTTLTGGLTANPNVALEDIWDVRNKGYVGMFYATPVIMIPNYFLNEQNTDWMFKEQDIFILPVDNNKPVKVALHGEIYTQQVQDPSGSMEFHAHRLMGVAIVFYNTAGIFRDSGNLVGTY